MIYYVIVVNSDIFVILDISVILDILDQHLRCLSRGSLLALNHKVGKLWWGEHMCHTSSETCMCLVYGMMFYKSKYIGESH